MTRYLLPVFGLGAIYSMILLSLHPWDMLAGVIITLGTLLLFQRHLRLRSLGSFSGLAQKAWALLHFAGYVFLDTAQGVWTVSAIVLGLRALDRSGIVAIPIGERTATGVAVTAWATTLSPGSVLIDVDWKQRVMLFHFIDVPEPELHRQKLQAFYERYQKPIFP